MPSNQRKSLDESLAAEFVFGAKNLDFKPPVEPPQPAEQPASSTPVTAPSKKRSVAVAEKSPKSDEPASTPAMIASASSSITEEDAGGDQEKTVRFTIDLTVAMHRKLSIRAAEQGRKKADIVRSLLEHALASG